MNLLDLLLLVALAFAAVGGFYYGFVARALSWIGAGAGLVIAAWLLPTIVRLFDTGGAIVRLFATLAVLVVGATIGGSIGETLGRQLRRAIPPGPLRVLDRIGGLAAGVVGLLVLVWFMTPIAADIPGTAARLVRNSAIVSTIAESTPRPPGPAQALRSIVGNARFPEVFEGMSPAPQTGTPPEQLPVSEAVVERVTASTVNVESVACGIRHEGSGFAVADGLVVTNAHVVAGGQDLQVRRPDGRVLSGEVVVFDPNRDLALIRVPDLAQSPLPLDGANERTQGAVLGYPRGQNAPRAQAAAVQSERRAVGRDIYGRNRVTRSIFILAARLMQGDSGGPLIDTNGAVVGVAFAIAPDQPATAYALTVDELRAVLDMPRDDGPGPCL